jgi:DNA-binding transcriptional MerR regulator
MAVIEDTPLVDSELLETELVDAEPVAPEPVEARDEPSERAAYSIAEVAERMQLNPHTLRYYERVGLLRVERDGGGRRVYREENLARIKFISCLRATGLPIRDLQAYFAMVDAGTHTEADRLELLERHRENVLAQMADIRESLAAIDFKIEMYGGRPHS